MRAAAKSSIYRHEVRRAAVDALVEAVGMIAAGRERPEPCPGPDPVTGRRLPPMRQDVRAIDWTVDGSDAVVRRIRAGDGHPGVLDEIGGVGFHLFGAHHEHALRGGPGEIVARRTGAICRATVDGAVWITHLRRADDGDGGSHFKLPATRALALAGVRLDAPEVTEAVRASLPHGRTYREISYEELGEVGFLRFDEMTARLTGPPHRAIGAHHAVGIGLLDAAFGSSVEEFEAGVRTFAARIAGARGFERLLHCKRARRAHDELAKPLRDYRREELERSHDCFFGPDRSYHDARSRFVHRLAAATVASARAA